MGTFALQESTLAATAIPNDTIARDESDIFLGDVAAHEAAVTDYLVHVGIESYEILSVSAFRTGVTSPTERS